MGRGSETYDEVDKARKAAMLHLANILPKPESERLQANQADLLWEPFRNPRETK